MKDTTITFFSNKGRVICTLPSEPKLSTHAEKDKFANELNIKYSFYVLRRKKEPFGYGVTKNGNLLIRYNFLLRKIVETYPIENT